uniref:Chitin-binding type-2 domain-containing protein n=1 Tax=Pinctada fucata TaxID=50426 RepID=A0A194ALF0_PINFU
MLLIFLTLLFFGGVISETCNGKPDGHYEVGCKAYLECKSGVANQVNCEDVGHSYVYNGYECADPSTVGPPCGDLRDCTGIADGKYADIYTNCTSYYTCHGGAFYGHNFCPAGLVYDESLGTCNWAYDVPPPCGTKVSILGK